MRPLVEKTYGGYLGRFVAKTDVFNSSACQMSIGATLYVTMVTFHHHFRKWWWLSPALFQSGICNFSSNSKLSEAFCSLKYTENAIAACWGSSRRSPRPPSRLGSGHPSTYPTPLGVFGASMLAPSAPRSSCPPDIKSWRRHWLPPLLKVKLCQCKWGMYWIRTDDTETLDIMVKACMCLEYVVVTCPCCVNVAPEENVCRLVKHCFFMDWMHFLPPSHQCESTVENTKNLP